MRRIVYSTGITAMFIFMTVLADAQDAGKAAAKNQVSHSSGQDDNLLGQKIKQQSLSLPFQKLDTTSLLPPKKKKIFKQ